VSPSEPVSAAIVETGDRSQTSLYLKEALAIGSTPAKALLNTKKPISQIRGQMQEVNGRMVMPTFNPAYLLRDATKKKEVWDDMKMVREFLAEI